MLLLPITIPSEQVQALIRTWTWAAIRSLLQHWFCPGSDHFVPCKKAKGRLMDNANFPPDTKSGLPGGEMEFRDVTDIFLEAASGKWIY